MFVADAANREVMEYDGGTGAILRWYAYGPGANDVVNRTDVASSTRTAYIPDIQGSIVATLSSSSGTLTPANYLPFGASASAPDTFAYTGQRIDPESGLYYYRARHYAPLLGRFLQPDPIRYRGGINLYAYVGNDPLNATDPNGLVADYIGSAATSAATYAYQNPLQTLGIVAAVGVTIFAPENAAALPEEIAGIEGTAIAAEETGTALSTLRYTQEGETFSHYGYASQADNFANGLRPGGYATDATGLTGEEAQSGLALPHASPPDAVYTVSPEPGTLVNVNPVVRPEFGQPGGLTEYQFPLGTGPGTISGPGAIP